MAVVSPKAPAVSPQPVHHAAPPPKHHQPAAATVRHGLQHDLVIGRIYDARVTETLAERSSSGRFRPPTGPRQEAVADFLGRPAPSLPANQTLDSRLPPARIGRCPPVEARARGSPAHPRTRPRRPETSGSPDAAAKQATGCPLVLTYPPGQPFTPAARALAGSRALGSLGHEAVVGSASSGGQCCLERCGFLSSDLPQIFFAPIFLFETVSVLPFKTWRVPLSYFPTCISGPTRTHTPPFLSPSLSHKSAGLLCVCVRVLATQGNIKSSLLAIDFLRSESQSAGHDIIRRPNFLFYIHILSLLQDALQPSLPRPAVPFGCRAS